MTYFPQHHAPRERLTPAEIEERVTAAANPATPPDQLASLYQDSYREAVLPRGIRETLGINLARNPNTPPAILAALAQIYPRPVIENPVFPLLPLENPNVIRHFAVRSLTGLLQWSDCPPAFVRLCVDHSDAEVCFAAREHITLAGEADPFAMDWQERAIDGLMALRMPAPNEIFDLIETDRLPRPFTERWPAVHEPETPQEFGFMERRIQRVARRATLRAKGKLPPIPTKPAEGWAGWVAELYRSDIEAAVTWAEDPAMPVEALRAFAETPKRRLTKKPLRSPAPAEIRRALARNPACPADLLDFVLFYDNAQNVAAHPNVTPEILARIVAKHQNSSKLSVVAASPKATPDILRQLYETITTTNIPARRLARWNAERLRTIDNTRHNNSDNEARSFPLLEEFLRSHHTNDILVFLNYATASAAPGRQAGYLEDVRHRAQQAAWWVRLAVAVNPHTPEEFRQPLTEDGCRLVRAAAHARLADPAHPILGL
jgi:hypothetical protein